MGRSRVVDLVVKLFWRSGKEVNGFTLVELLIGVAILAMLAVIAAMTVNPISMANKGYDAQRKKDLRRIKIAFEDYFGDKGMYPPASLVNLMMDKSNCGTNIFAPWLPTWPCDPKGNPYLVSVGEDPNRPRWFKIMANLDNKEDKEIPVDWNQSQTGFTIGDGSYNASEANYGVSSENVDWSEYKVLAKCLDACYYRPSGAGSCQQITDCLGPNCYGDHNCSDECQMVRCPSASQ